MIVYCPSCCAALKLPDASAKAGKRIHCPKCQNVFPLEAPAAEVSSSPGPVSHEQPVAADSASTRPAPGPAAERKRPYLTVGAVAGVVLLVGIAAFVGGAYMVGKIGWLDTTSLQDTPELPARGESQGETLPLNDPEAVGASLKTAHQFEAQGTSAKAPEDTGAKRETEAREHAKEAAVALGEIKAKIAEKDYEAAKDAAQEALVKYADTASAKDFGDVLALAIREQVGARETQATKAAEATGARQARKHGLEERLAEVRDKLRAVQAARQETAAQDATLGKTSVGEVGAIKAQAEVEVLRAQGEAIRAQGEATRRRGDDLDARLRQGEAVRRVQQQLLQRLAEIQTWQDNAITAVIRKYEPLFDAIEAKARRLAQDEATLTVEQTRLLRELQEQE